MKKDVLKKEKGSVMVLVALSIVVLIGFSALAVDGGNLYSRHTRLQDIADSTALAAAMEHKPNADNVIKKGAAFDTGLEYLKKNGITVVSKDNNQYTATISYGSDEPGTMAMSFSPDVNKVTVDLEVDTRLYLARVLNKNSTPVSVKATAMRGVASKQTGHLIPVAFFYDDYTPNTPYEMTLAPQDGSSGNYGFLDFDDPNQFSNYLEDGFGGTLSVGMEVPTYTGVTAGPVDQAFESRITECQTNHVPECTFDTVKPDCSRLVFVPIVSEFFDSNGKKMVKIIGFAKFFIQSYDKNSKILKGVFLEELNNSEITGTSSEFMVGSVRLIDSEVN